MGVQILVSVRFQVWVFVWIWYIFGEKVQNRVWPWWISCSFPLQESKKQLLLGVLWQLFYKSKSHAKAIWGEPSDQTGSICLFWKTISRWKQASMISCRVIQFPQQNGWTTGQWFYCLIAIIQVLSKKSTEESRVQKRKWRYCPAVIREYNTYMGGVDLCDQMKVSYEVDRRGKVRFYLPVFFDFLDISVVNSRIV